MPSFVGGVDISFYKNTDKAVACLVVLRYPSLEKVAELYYPCVMSEPYMPGFLAFREVGHLKTVVEQFLEQYPEVKNNLVIMVDGNGILHYRGFGAASHLGVVLNIPTIGVGKELLVVDGMNKEEIVDECLTNLRQFGDCVDLIGPNSGRLYGQAMRTVRADEPIYISIGHKISLETAVALVKSCCKRGSLLPEPVRLADGLSRDYIADTKAGLPARQNKITLSHTTIPSSSHRSIESSPPLSAGSAPTPSKWDGKRIVAAAKIMNSNRSPQANTDKNETNKGIVKQNKKAKLEDDKSSPLYRDTSTSSSPLYSNSSTKEEIKEIFPSLHKWNCPCGAVVLGAVMCQFCRHIDM